MHSRESNTRTVQKGRIYHGNMGHQNNPYEKKPKHNSVGNNNHTKNLIGPMNPSNPPSNPKKIISEVYPQDNVKNLKKYESLIGKKK
jgi:hypothetical protein